MVGGCVFGCLSHDHPLKSHDSHVTCWWRSHDHVLKSHDSHVTCWWRSHDHVLKSHDSHVNCWWRSHDHVLKSHDSHVTCWWRSHDHFLKSHDSRWRSYGHVLTQGGGCPVPVIPLLSSAVQDVEKGHFEIPSRVVPILDPQSIS